MNWNGLLGILALIYAMIVAVVAAKKPESIWDMAKVRMFKKMLGEKGTVIFFYVFAVVFAGLGLWLLIGQPIAS